MSAITVDFEFELFDIVYLKHAEYSRKFSPVKHIITERVAIECHGGIQKSYHLFDGKGSVPEPILSKSKPAYEGWNTLELPDETKQPAAEKETD